MTPFQRLCGFRPDAGIGRMAGTRAGRPTGIAVAVLVVALGLAACGSSSKQPSSGALVTTASTAAGPKAPPAVQLRASDGAAGDYLGGALYYDTFVSPIKPTYYATPGEAAMSSDGTVALVGAPGHGKGTGAAYVFTKQGSKWAQAAKLSATGGGLYDGLGWSVALSGDGLTAVAGAPYKNMTNREDIGAAYVFRNAGTTWSQV